MTDGHPPADAGLVRYRLEKAEAHIENLERHIEKLDAEIVRIRREAEEREKKRLSWGIGALGSVVMMLGGVIWAYRGVIFK